MSVSAANSGYSDPNAFVPVFASENATSAATEKQQDAKHLTLFGEGDDNPSFWDLLDVINPLQHIPVVNEIYQELTGDKIGVAARLTGGTLFGGPIGLVASAIGCLVEEETGDTLGGHALALFRDDDTAPDTTQVAAAPPQPAVAAETPQPAPAPVQVAMAEPPPPATAATPLMFNAAGMITPSATAAVEPAAAPPAAKPMPLINAAQPARFMPAPARTVSAAENTPPPISVPVSSGSNRSNVPITGRDPLASRVAPDPLAVQKAMAQQGLGADVQHPMLQTAAAPAGGNPDWFQAMNQALDKYQKAGNLAARAENPDPQPLQ